MQKALHINQHPLVHGDTLRSSQLFNNTLWVD